MRLSVKNKHKETMRAKITYACKRYDWASGVLSDPLPLKRLPNRADEVYKK